MAPACTVVLMVELTPAPKVPLPLPGKKIICEKMSQACLERRWIDEREIYLFVTIEVRGLNTEQLDRTTVPSGV